MKISIRTVMLGCIAADLILAAVLTLRADTPWAQPGGVVYVAKALGGLFGYGLLFLALPLVRSERIHASLRLGASMGVLGGIILALLHVLESFGSHVGEKPPVTLGFMVAAFLAWSVAAYRVARWSADFLASVLTACWAAMISVTLAVTFGLALVLGDLPSPDYVAFWGEYQRSGWTSARAFGVASAFDATLGHLLAGPFIGGIFGVFGYGITRFRRENALVE